MDADLLLTFRVRLSRALPRLTVTYLETFKNAGRADVFVASLSDETIQELPPTSSLRQDICGKISTCCVTSDNTRFICSCGFCMIQDSLMLTDPRHTIHKRRWRLFGIAIGSRQETSRTTSFLRMRSEAKTSAGSPLLKEINLKVPAMRSGFMLTSPSNTWLCLRRNDRYEGAKNWKFQDWCHAKEVERSSSE